MMLFHMQVLPNHKVVVDHFSIFDSHFQSDILNMTFKVNFGYPFVAFTLITVVSIYISCQFMMKSLPALFKS